MTKCMHEDVWVTPKNIERRDGGVVIKNLNDAEAVCKKCRKPIAMEDVFLRDEKHIFILVPEDVIDG